MESVEVYSQSSLIPTFMYVYKESDIFVTWDGATLKFESSMQSDFRWQNYICMA